MHVPDLEVIAGSTLPSTSIYWREDGRPVQAAGSIVSVEARTEPGTEPVWVKTTGCVAQNGGEDVPAIVVSWADDDLGALEAVDGQTTVYELTVVAEAPGGGVRKCRFTVAITP